MTGTEPSPDLFFQTAQAYQRTAALQAAVELDVFTAIDGGAATAAAIAESCSASERGIRILCDNLTIIGFLDKSDGRYGLTADTRMFLSRKSPAYLGGALSFLNAEPVTRGFEHLAAIVRRGTLLGDLGTMEPESAVWVEFARAMAPLTTIPAEKIGDALQIEDLPGGTVLDLAAGHGLFGITLARRNPRLQVIAQDWSMVLEVAVENAAAAGVYERLQLLPGSAFDVDYGTGHELVLLTNFLHHFDRATCTALLGKVRDALAADGRVVILEFVPDDDRVQPPLAASFSLGMLANTPGGDAYTFAELQGMLQDAGFDRIAMQPLGTVIQQVVIATRSV